VVLDAQIAGSVRSLRASASVVMCAAGRRGDRVINNDLGFRFTRALLLYRVENGGVAPLGELGTST
jgi:hypothetical protein